MKKLVFIIVASTLLAGTSYAQNSNSDSRDKLSIGLKIGANLSNVYDSQGDQFNADSKFGLAAGAFVSIPIVKYLGIQPEILFSQKGFKGSGSILGSDYSFTHTTNYIDVPLLVAIKPISALTILAGPQYSYLVKQKYVFNSALVNIDQEKEFSNDNVRKNILCFIGGFDFNIDQIVIGARAGWDFQTNNGDGTSTTPRYKNMWYQATIGFRL
jgi:hypothetical protein